MKAITIRQPWVWCILHADKDVENRTWSTDYRGPIAIHAAKAWNTNDFRTASIMSKGVLPVPPTRDCFDQMRRESGHVIAIARLVDVVTSHESPWFHGPYGFVLRDVWPVAPVAVRGKLGLFEIDEKLIRGCEA